MVYAMSSLALWASWLTVFRLRVGIWISASTPTSRICIASQGFSSRYEQNLATCLDGLRKKRVSDGNQSRLLWRHSTSFSLRDTVISTLSRFPTALMERKTASRSLRLICEPSPKQHSVSRSASHTSMVSSLQNSRLGAKKISDSSLHSSDYSNFRRKAKRAAC
jgi:hypothetical protein